VGAADGGLAPPAPVDLRPRAVQAPEFTGAPPDLDDTVRQLWETAGPDRSADPVGPLPE
jgi:hypothetical protein